MSDPILVRELLDCFKRLPDLQGSDREGWVVQIPERRDDLASPVDGAEACTRGLRIYRFRAVRRSSSPYLQWLEWEYLP